jgi:hypothetical protein
MRRLTHDMPPLFVRLLSGFLVMAPYTASHAGALPTSDNCRAAIARVREVIKTLPPGGMSRRFAQSDLVQAASEAGNGEFDDCLEFAAQAEAEVRHPQHAAAAASTPKR